MSYFEDCYDKAISGDATALEALKGGAEVGNEEAMHLLSCVYGNMSSTFYDDKLYQYWEEQKCLFSEKKSQRDKTIQGEKESVSVSQTDENYKANNKFGTKDYRPNWTIAKKKREAEYNKETEHKAPSPSLVNFLFSGEGRVSQSDYLIFLFFYVVVFFLIVASAAGSSTGILPAGLLCLGYLLFYPFLQIATKRCHDIGQYGINLFIPFYFVYLLFVPGEKGKNEFGYPPVDFFNPEI